MSIPSLIDIMELWRDTINNSTTLDSYCQTTFGQSFSVFVGLDPKNPPKISQAPFLLVVPDNLDSGLTVGAHNYNVIVHIGIKDDEYSDFQSNGTSEMRGIYRINQMWEYVWDDIETAANGKNLIADRLSYSINTDAFPLIQAMGMIGSSLPNTIGVNITL